MCHPVYILDRNEPPICVVYLSTGLEYRSNTDSNVCTTPECVTAGTTTFTQTSAFMPWIWDANVFLELKWFLGSRPCFALIQRPDCSRTWTPVWNHARTSISTPVEAGTSVTSFPRRAHFTASLISWETSWRLYSRVCYVRIMQLQATCYCSEFAGD